INIGREVLQQVDGPVHAFCGGVGTAGMLMGVSQALREAHSSARILALEPASSAIISTGVAGTHHIEGIGIGFIPPLLNTDAYHEARGIDETEARQLGPGHTVVTVAVDTGLKYLAGDLYEV